MNTEGVAISCGVMALYDLGEANETLRVVALKNILRNWSLPAMFIYSDTVARNHGAKLSALIRKRKLGTVNASKKAANPFSGNKIQTWIWVVDRAAVRRFLKTKK